MTLRPEGFVLVAVLWLLLAGVMAVGYLSVWIEDSVTNQTSARLRAELQIESHSAKSGLLYTLSTQRLTVAGVTTDYEAPAGFPTEMTVAAKGGELRLDGRVYSLGRNLRFSLQDQRGLINPNHATDGILSHFLSLYGVVSEDRPGLIAALRDYIDADNTYRLNGAEKIQYREKGIEGPANRLLRSPLEIRKVIGWEDIPLEDSVLLQYFSTVPGSTININTATQQVIELLPGFSTDMARRVVALREDQLITNLDQLSATAGKLTPEDLESAIFFPSRYIAITLWGTRLASGTHYVVKLTPMEEGKKPWQILHAFNHYPTERADLEAAEVPDVTKAIFY